MRTAVAALCIIEGQPQFKILKLYKLRVINYFPVELQLPVSCSYYYVGPLNRLLLPTDVRKPLLFPWQTWVLLVMIE